MRYMKKTLMALVLAATAVSGSAMAWTANGTGGTMEFGGTLTPQNIITPWEVKVGAPVTTLNADIVKGVNFVDIPVTTAIPVLGIRTINKTPFVGKTGIAPQIDFKRGVNLDSFAAGVTTLTLPVVDTDNPTTEIGSMTTKFAAAGRNSAIALDGSAHGNRDLYASTAGMAFFGGLPKSGNSVASSAITLINSISAEYSANYTAQSANDLTPVETAFTDSNYKSSAYYGAGIQAGSTIRVTLKAPAANDAIKWKAVMPVTVSYQ